MSQQTPAQAEAESFYVILCFGCGPWRQGAVVTGPQIVGKSRERLIENGGIRPATDAEVVAHAEQFGVPRGLRDEPYPDHWLQPLMVDPRPGPAGVGATQVLRDEHGIARIAALSRAQDRPIPG